ncbi:metallophosphoesterase [Aerococcus sanguinicola]|uniref:Calcineurin-like phosphoesterase domain-containing protein n=1 Tax=Aerococcus sanguinicola TaxID=119206 RepID=A0A2I1MQ47_9LACT|nr:MULTISPECIES: metallophosphoesterase [Aerococcus]MDK7050129.1 metallophosphoesterase [Aerococcus sanguinicola]OFT93328.1 hypothetical protein HMPREF3090_07335 [Aerococcus sp. HMSC23C02]PKZ22267.1 hypothetical protein CYJ28_03920 [Aerococcus sanguinicola]
MTKIIQLTDLHIGSSLPFNELDAQTLQAVQDLVSLEKPDYLVLSGDVIWSHVPHSLQNFEEVLKFFDRLEVPYAVTYGNHDSEIFYLQDKINMLVEESSDNLEKLLSENEELASFYHHRDEIDVYGRAELNDLVRCSQNHVCKEKLTVVNNREMYVVSIDEQTQLLIVDSGDYDETETGQYAYLEDQQIDWIIEQTQDPSKQSHLFIHIPIPEYAQAIIDGQAEGHQSEEVCSSALNTGLYAQIKIRNSNIVAIYAGHDHENDFVSDFYGIKLIYGRCSGYNAYGDLNRGARVIEISDNNMTTYIKEFA